MDGQKRCQSRLETHLNQLEGIDIHAGGTADLNKSRPPAQGFSRDPVRFARNGSYVTSSSCQYLHKGPYQKEIYICAHNVQALALLSGP